MRSREEQKENILMGYLYWEYNDTIIWVNEVKNGFLESKSTEERQIQNYKEFVSKHSNELMLFAKKAEEAQRQIEKESFVKNKSVYYVESGITSQ
jgi:hypothetical protein